MTNGERDPKAVDARGPGKEATASDENYHRSRPPSGKIPVGTAGSEL